MLRQSGAYQSKFMQDLVKESRPSIQGKDSFAELKGSFAGKGSKSAVDPRRSIVDIVKPISNQEELVSFQPTKEMQSKQVERADSQLHNEDKSKPSYKPSRSSDHSDLVEQGKLTHPDKGDPRIMESAEIFSKAKASRVNEIIDQQHYHRVSGLALSHEQVQNYQNIHDSYEKYEKESLKQIEQIVGLEGSEQSKEKIKEEAVDGKPPIVNSSVIYLEMDSARNQRTSRALMDDEQPEQ